jgi:hypothetical protein
VAGDDGIVGINEDRIGKAEMRDRGCELLDLLLLMRARIRRAGFERADRLVGDLKVGHGWAPYLSGAVAKKNKARLRKFPKTTPSPWNAMDLLKQDPGPCPKPPPVNGVEQQPCSRAGHPSKA